MLEFFNYFRDAAPLAFTLVLFSIGVGAHAD